MLDDGVERDAEAVAVIGVQHVYPVAHRSVERALAQAQYLRGFRPAMDDVAGDVPVPHDVARARQRQLPTRSSVILIIV